MLFRLKTIEKKYIKLFGNKLKEIRKKERNNDNNLIDW